MILITHHEQLHILAIIFIVCAVIVFLIDVAVEFGFRPAIWAKWSLAWFIVRYIGIICAVLLALDILIYEET